METYEMLRQRFFRRLFWTMVSLLSAALIMAWFFLNIGFSREKVLARVTPAIKNSVRDYSVAKDSVNQTLSSPTNDWQFYPGDYRQQQIIGHSLPSGWRPYHQDSPWNSPISPDIEIYPDSGKIIAEMEKEAKHLRLVKIYTPPIWVVNSIAMSGMPVRSNKIFDTWDQDKDGWTDSAVPITPEMWGEPTEDGHIIIIDPFLMMAWEMSSFRWQQSQETQIPTATTFNMWDLKGKGYAKPFGGQRWHQRGGRGSGFPVLAGIIRPEELQAGEIRHALMFNYSKNRKGKDDKEIFIAPPACRSDGDFEGQYYPIEGMRFQLNPALTDTDFDHWGLSKEGKIIAKALQRYGMFLGDNGGAMSLGIQLLGRTSQQNLRLWEQRFPGLFAAVKRIPTREFRIIFTEFPLEG